MSRKWKECGQCREEQLLETIFAEGYQYFAAFLTDRFVAGKADTLEQGLNELECDKILELRLFSEEKEALGRRTMIGENHLFQWRVASEDGLDEMDYLVKYQTLDIDAAKIRSTENGGLQLMTTGGGCYSLPISPEEDRIKIISYIGYDESGMAYIYDNRLAGFVTKGGTRNE